MSKYIDAEKLYAEAVKWEREADTALSLLKEKSKDNDEHPKWSNDRWPRWSTRLNERTSFKHYIMDFERADVEEVRHGKWERTGWQKGYETKNRETEYRCSECKRNKIFIRKTQKLPKYCSNCGAKMDGGKE